MDNLSSEMKALITAVIYLDCRMKAIVNLLAEKGITLREEVIEAATHKIHATEGDVKRYEMLCRIKDDKFDIR